MTVERVENPADGSEITIVKGVVDQIFFKAIENDKYQNTHRASVRIGEDWVNNINIKTKEGFDPQVRFNNGTQGKPDWQALEVGDNVRLVVNESEANGKTYYNGAVSKIKLIKKGSSVKTKSTEGGGVVKETYKPRDNSGVETGHALNGALNLVRNGVVERDSDEIVSSAQIVHNITVELKKEYAKMNPQMSEYDIGAMVGHAVLNATRDVNDVAEIEQNSRFLLDHVVPLVSAFVKGEKKVTKITTKVTKTTPNKEEKQETEYTPDFSDVDDDIPF